MPESQGRGAWYEEGKVEQAAKYAHENGHDDASVRAAARQILRTDVSEAVEAVRRKMRQLFGH